MHLVLSQLLIWAAVSAIRLPWSIWHRSQDILVMLMRPPQHRGDMHRWKEFPGLAAAVNQVTDITRSNVYAKWLPGSLFQFNAPTFDDEPPWLVNTQVIKSNHVTTGPAVNRNPFQASPTKVEVEVEEGEIKDEDQVRIKQEPEDEPGVSVDIGPPERLPSPYSVTINDDPQASPRHFGYLCPSGFGNCPPGSPPWVSQPPFIQPGYPPNYWHGLPNHYGHHPFPAVYPAMPYCNFDFFNLGPDDKVVRAHAQFSHDPNHPQFHAIPQRLSSPVPPPPGISPGAFLPPPSLPPPSLAQASPILPSQPSPASSLPTAPALEPAVPKKPDEERGSERKLSNSPGASSDTSRPLKRHIPTQGGSESGTDDDRQTQSKIPRLACGLLDFRTWFRGQVVDAKKRLSHLERTSTPTDTRKGA
ncbi:hypothetical protein F5883DRAFT_560227 [Diaporthe sp. PMI_573]|nr:hypothetical protein F5883DRAFT_560227 [Diaporthaceae sp. PMI_573]